MASGYALADPIYIMWAAKDISFFPSAYATSIAKQFNIPFVSSPTPAPVLGTSSNLPNETGAAPSEPPLSASGSGLSTGAKAGIGIGAAFATASSIGAAFLVLCLRRRRQQQRITVGAPGNELPEIVDGSKERLRR